MTNLIKKLARSKARIALIDADSVLYGIALSASVQTSDGDTLEVKDGEQCYQETVARLEGLVGAVGATDAIVCLTPTGAPQFRRELLPSYKANRASFIRPALLRPLQAMLQERLPFGCIAVKGLEADDVCGISSGNLQKANLREPVIVSIDKDMRSIPGLLYSWLKKETGIEEITGAAADRAHLYQTLVGDPTDNYTGLPGCGPVKANKALDFLWDASPWARWEWIVGMFNKRGFSAEYALTQARVARILRADDWDAEAKRVRLWKPSKSTITDNASAPQPGDVPAEIASSLDAQPQWIRLADILPGPSETVH